MSEDLISRQAAIDAVEKAVFKGDAESATTTDCNYTCSDCKHQDKAYEQEPCYSCFNNDGAGYEPDTDCISRQDAIEEIALHDCTNGEVPYFTGKGVQEILNTLPPVTPTERTGEWVEHDPKTKGFAKIYECPFCGDEVIGEETNFCPNCGADMRGEK